MFFSIALKCFILWLFMSASSKSTQDQVMMACLWPVSNGHSFVWYAGVRIDRVRGGRQKYKRADPPNSLLAGSKVSQGEYVSYCFEDCY